MTELPEPDPVNAARRRTRRSIRLPADAACVLCGITDADALIPNVRLLLAEHNLGEEFAPDIFTSMCRNCNAAYTVAQQDQQALPPPGPRPRKLTLPETIERMFRALAVFMHALAHLLIELADAMRVFVGGLDLDFPGWRERTWAQWPPVLI